MSPVSNREKTCAYRVGDLRAAWHAPNGVPERAAPEWERSSTYRRLDDAAPIWVWR
jgi:hypothetical protein